MPAGLAVGADPAGEGVGIAGMLPDLTGSAGLFCADGNGAVGSFFLIIGLGGGVARRGWTAIFADVVSDFPQQGQNLMTISHSSQ